MLSKSENEEESERFRQSQKIWNFKIAHRSWFKMKYKEKQIKRKKKKTREKNPKNPQIR